MTSLELLLLLWVVVIGLQALILVVLILWRRKAKRREEFLMVQISDVWRDVQAVLAASTRPAPASPTYPTGTFLADDAQAAQIEQRLRQAKQGWLPTPAPSPLASGRSGTPFGTGISTPGARNSGGA